MPRPLFVSVSEEYPVRSTLAIGQTEEEGPVVCYVYEEEGIHSRLVYLYTGRDSYEMWRSYMKQLGEWQRADKPLGKWEQPRVSEVQSTLEKHPCF